MAINGFCIVLYCIVNQSKTNTRRHKQNNNKTTDQYKQRQHVLKIMLTSQNIIN